MCICVYVYRLKKSCQTQKQNPHICPQTWILAYNVYMYMLIGIPIDIV